jgi:hypothetical protein
MSTADSFRSRSGVFASPISQDKTSYKSTKTLGILYRDVVQELKLKPEMLERVPNPFSRRVSVGIERLFSTKEQAFLSTHFEHGFMVPGYEAYLPRACDLQAAYNTELLRLMNKYGVYDEGQLVSGHIMTFSTKAHKRANHHDLKERIRHSLQVAWCHSAAHAHSKCHVSYLRSSIWLTFHACGK